MKKTILLLCACAIGYSAMAQKNDDSETRLLKNEISSNILDLVVAGSLNVSYERFLNDNISLAGSATFFDTYGYNDAANLESTNAFSFRASANFYVSKRRKFEGFYFYPLIKLRSGEVGSDFEIFIEDGQGNTRPTNSNTYSISGFSAGVGLGNKWVIQDRLTVTVFGELARNLGTNLAQENDLLLNIEGRFGINFGYRF